MLTKSRIALATALLALTGSVALADFDPNLANRYRAPANPIGSQGVMRSAPVKLLQSRNAAMTNRQVPAEASWFEIDRADRASSPYAGGG